MKTLNYSVDPLKYIEFHYIAGREEILQCILIFNFVMLQPKSPRYPEYYSTHTHTT